MTVQNLIDQLNQCNPNDTVVFASDEELNTVRTEGEVSQIEDTEVVIYGLDGSERL